MSKEFVTIATLCLCLVAWTPTAMAQSKKPTCEQQAQDIQTAQDKIDKTRRAYSQSAKVLDERLKLADAAYEKKENMDALWADVLSSRDVVMPRAKAALTALNNGYALMQKYVSAGCDDTTATELEDRRKRGALRYEKSITALESIPQDWDTYYNPPPPPTPAECEALDNAHKKAEAKAKAYSLKNDAKIAAYRKARWAVNDAIDLERPFRKEWKKLLKTRKAALPATKGYADLMKNVFAPIQKGLKNNCVQMTYKEQKAFESNVDKVLSEISDSYSRMIKMPLKAEDYVEMRRKTTTPRVGIINKTDQILCYYLNGTGKGRCVIKPKGTKIVELKSDTPGKPQSTLLITERISRKDNQDGQAQPEGIKICAKRTFDHQSGSKAWVINTGVEDGCALPAAKETKDR